MGIQAWQQWWISHWQTKKLQEKKKQNKTLRHFKCLLHKPLLLIKRIFWHQTSWKGDSIGFKNSAYCIRWCKQLQIGKNPSLWSLSAPVSLIFLMSWLECFHELCSCVHHGLWESIFSLCTNLIIQIRKMNQQINWWQNNLALNYTMLW